MEGVLESKSYHLEFEDFEKCDFRMFKGIGRYDLVYFGDKDGEDEFWVCSKRYFRGVFVLACKKRNPKNLKLPGYYKFTFDNEKVVERYFDEQGKLHSYDDRPGEILFRNGKPFRRTWCNHGVLTRKEGFPFLIEMDEDNDGFEQYGRSSKLNNTFGSAIKFYKNGELEEEQFYKDGRRVKREIIMGPVEKVLNKSVIKNIGRIKNRKTVELYKKIAEFYNVEDVLEICNSKLVMLKLEGK